MRIAAISDQHGFLPAIPTCDLLMVGGDICPDSVDGAWAVREPRIQRAWFDREFRPWLAASAALRAVAIWGNHDFCGEACDFAADAPGATPGARLELLGDQATTVVAGPRTITIWGSPWSNQFGYWAFMKTPRELAEIYARIPEGTDILLSHQPPYGYGDAIDGEHVGSRELLAAIDRVRPKAVICGHIHEGHGVHDHHGIPIYNVAVVDERYQLVHQATVIDW